MNGLLEGRRLAAPSVTRDGCMRFLLAILTGLMSAGAFAATYADSGIRMSIPEGFEGPRTHVIQRGKVVGFVKKIPGDDRGTLLQITTQDFGQALAAMPERDRQDVTDKIFGQFLAGGAKARQSFRVVTRRHVVLDGVKASRAELVGDVNGYPLSAVMYCVIVGTRAVVFLMQDFRDAPPDNSKDALKAIDSISFPKE